MNWFPIVLWLLWLLPFVAAVLVWVRVCTKWRVKPIRPAGIVSLAFLTASAGLAALGLVYVAFFAHTPRFTPTYLRPEYGVYGWVVLLSIPSFISGFVGFAWGAPGWLCSFVLLLSAWLFAISFLAGATI